MTDWQVLFQWKLMQFQLCICAVFTGCMTALSGSQHQSHLSTSLLASLPNNLSSNNLNIIYSQSKIIIYKGLRNWWIVQEQHLELGIFIVRVGAESGEYDNCIYLEVYCNFIVIVQVDTLLRYLKRHNLHVEKIQFASLWGGFYWNDMDNGLTLYIIKKYKGNVSWEYLEKEENSIVNHSAPFIQSTDQFLLL